MSEDYSATDTSSFEGFDRYLFTIPGQRQRVVAIGVGVTTGSMFLETEDQGEVTNG